QVLLRDGYRENGRATRLGRLARERRTPDRAAVFFEDAPRERQREAHAAAMLVEGTPRRRVCVVDAIAAGHDDYGRASSTFLDAAPIHDDGRRPGRFAQNGPKHGPKRRLEPSRIALRRSPRFASKLQMDPSILSLMHDLG